MRLTRRYHGCPALAAVAVLLLLAAGLAGCGSARTRPAGGAQAAPGEGEVRFTVAWPARSPAGGRLIPPDADVIEIAVAPERAGELPLTGKITRPSTSLTIVRVPAGWARVRAVAYATGKGAALAVGAARIEVKPLAAVQCPLSLDSTIVSVVVTALPAEILVGGTTLLTAMAKDDTGQTVLSSGFGWTLSGDAAAVDVGPQGKDNLTLTGKQKGVVTVTAREAQTGTTGSLVITVSDRPNEPPVITGWTVEPDPVPPGGAAQISANAADPDGDVLTYTWQAAAGTLAGTGATVSWKAPDTEGTYDVTVSVNDAKHPAVTDTRPVVVARGPRFRVTEIVGMAGVMGMNHKGHVVGLAPGGSPGVWQDGTTTPLPAPSPAPLSCTATDIDDQGVVVGLAWYRGLSDDHGAYYPSGTWARACLWTNGQPTLLPHVYRTREGGPFINASGQVAGTIELADYTNHFAEGQAALDGNALGSLYPLQYLEYPPGYPSPAYAPMPVGGSYDVGGYTGNGGSSACGLNDSGQVVANCFWGMNGPYVYPGIGWEAVYHPVVFSGGSKTDLGSGTEHSRANAINNAGHVVGWFGDARTPCLWAGGGRTALPFPAGTSFGEPLSISNAGQIAGYCSDDAGSYAVLWESGAAIDLNTASDPLPDGGTLSRALKVNDAGQILCLGSSGRYYLLSPR